MRFTLGKDQRLKSRKQIDQIFRKGKSMNLFPYRVYYMLGAPVVSGAVNAVHAVGPAGAGKAAGCLKAGFGASRRGFKKAVDRNRIKRLTREAYRLQKGPLEELVKERKLSLSLFFIYTGKELPLYPLVSAKIAVALEKIVKEIGS